MSTRRQPPAGDFRFEHPIEVRFADTDAFGHVNNAVYLTYFEAARAGYYATVAGTPFGTGDHASEHTFVVADASLVYRRPAFFGERLLVGCRFTWASRSSFGLEYRVRAEGSSVGEARLVADGLSTQVMFDLQRNRVSRVPADLLEKFEAYEGRPIPRR
ncbi:MAG TPA: thioesterase family protein [Candidatus Limnocylindrales bacterium]|nr:thioesterase family protein [Candidatus Limnocylindrales bacterium]